MVKEVIIIPIFLLASSFLACQQNGASPPTPGLQCKDNKTLLVRYEGEGDVVQFKMLEGLHQTLRKVGDHVFEAQVEVPGCDEALFSYQIIVHAIDKDGKAVELPYGKTQPGSSPLLWHGKKRNGPYSPQENLQGKLVDTLFGSPSLQAERGNTIYWPKEYGQQTPIIYCTHGTMVKSYALYLDRLITEGKIKPVILVGVHSSNTHRYEEYVANGGDTAIFYRHKRFFFDEIMPNFEADIPGWQGRRYLYGFSNGAAFCVYAGIHHPALFEAVIAYSTADYISEFGHSIKFDSRKKYPPFYMGAGRYETSIFKDNLRFVNKMKDNNIGHQFKEFISGHDYQVWREEFLGFLERELKG